VLDIIIRELNMPRSLHEVGVGREKLETLAGHALDDKWCRTNPLPIVHRSQVLEILETVV
jgi:alcohol dehydrogenase class IV